MYWSKTLPKRWAFAREALYQPWYRTLFDTFLSWGRQRMPDMVLALKAHRYCNGFRALEQQIPDAAQINAERLLEAFTPEELRRMEHLLAFLRDQGFSTPDRATSEASAERRRIQQSIEIAADEPNRSILKRYAEYLQNPDPDRSALAPRTCRLYMTAASRWLAYCDDAQPDQKQLERFLKAKPGQRASLYPFVRYLHETTGRALTIPAKKKRRSRSVLIQRGRTMFRQINHALDKPLSFQERKSLSAALVVGLTGVGLNVVLMLPREALRVQNEQGLIQLEEQWGQLPKKHNQQLLRYVDELQRRHNRDTPYLFPGRPDFQPMHPTSIAHHLAKYGVSIQAVKAQATHRLGKSVSKRAI